MLLPTRRWYSIDELINYWGYPTNNRVIAGKNLYYWEKNTGFTTNYNRYTPNFSSSENYCNVIFEVNKRNIIVGGQWDGTDSVCPYTQNQAKGKRFFSINPQNDLIQKKKDFEKEQKRLKKEQERLEKEMNKT